MKHLSTAEFVDEVEGRLPEARRTHLGACGACAAQAAVLREAIGVAQQADIPEPSPLFWEHMSGRIADAVRGTTPEPQAWWRHPAWAIACSVVLVAAVLIGLRDARVPPPARTASPSALAPAAASIGEDPAWNLLTDVASTMEQENPDASPVQVRPSEVDRAVTDLSAAERQELRRLLENEMKGSGN